MRLHRLLKEPHFFIEEKIGLSACRNLGVSKATSALIAFVDDDAMLSEEWSGEIYKAFAKYPDASGLTGNPEAISVPPWFPRSCYWIIGADPYSKEGIVDFVNGCNMIFRQEVLFQCKFGEGFSQGQMKGKAGLVGDDVDFAIRLGKQIVNIPSIKVFHKVSPQKLKLGYILRYGFWQGFSERRYDRLYPNHRKQKRSGLLSHVLSDLKECKLRDLPQMLLVLISVFFSGAIGYLYA